MSIKAECDIHESVDIYPGDYFLSSPNDIAKTRQQSAALFNHFAEYKAEICRFEDAESFLARADRLDTEKRYLKLRVSALLQRSVEAKCSHDR